MTQAFQLIVDPIVLMLAEKVALALAVLVIGLWLLHLERSRH